MNGIWIKDEINTKNITALYTLSLKEKQDFKIELIAGAIFKIYVDNKMVFFGPMRAAHHYARKHILNLNGKDILIYINNPNIKTFSFLKGNPYFYCNLYADNKIYTANDFKAYIDNRRIKKVPRYSYQRGFVESYIYNDSVFNNIDFKECETVEVELPKILPNIVNYPPLNIINEYKEIDNGYILKTNNHDIPYQRYFYLINNPLEGYFFNECEDNPLYDYVSFKDVKEKNDLQYHLYKFDHSYTGFINIDIDVNEASDVYVVFEEILVTENGKKTLNVLRNETNNCFKYKLNKKGLYHLSSFEPYTYQYVKIICKAGSKVNISITEYVNPNYKNFAFKSSDDDINLIVEAAMNSFAANAVDLLTDCPSRERSGWLSDSYFSSVAERVLTGSNLVEKAFLQNYALADTTLFPKGMIPMNYPSDNYNSMFIPNWSLWYIMEIIKSNDINIINEAKDRVYGILSYFKAKENEYGLLENLESWVFIEWSKANDESHIKGVNIPSNIQYLRVLEEAGRIYNEPNWISKASKIKKFIKEKAFDGLLLVDNLIRDDKNNLVKTKNFTEACQYYAFWFKAIDKNEYKELYDLLMNKLGANKEKGFMEYVEKPNMIYGIYMRLDLLMEDNNKEEIIKEVKYYFLNMAKETKTLWEHTSILASLNHAFASYCLKFIIFALTSYNIMNKTFVDNQGINIDCDISIPLNISNTKKLIITAKNNTINNKIV